LLKLYLLFADYKYLGVLRAMFPEVPILGVTATATTKIIVDVQKMLDIPGCLVLKATFNRPNLFYEVSGTTCHTFSSTKVIIIIILIKKN